MWAALGGGGWGALCCVEVCCAAWRRGCVVLGDGGGAGGAVLALWKHYSVNVAVLGDSWYFSNERGVLTGPQAVMRGARVAGACWLRILQR